MKKKIYILFIILICVGLGLVYFVFGERKKPIINVSPDLIYTNAQKTFQVVAKDEGLGLKQLRVILKQNMKRITVLEQVFPAKTMTWSGEFKLPKLKQGPFELLIICTDRSWNNWGKGNTSLYVKKMVYDTKAPLISLVSKKHNLSQGGAGLVVYKVSEDVTQTGVEVGKYFFPAYKQKNGLYYCLFAYPYDARPGEDMPTITALDLAENKAKSGFYYHLNKRKFRHDKINISDRFLKAKMPQFQSIFPEEKDLLHLFLRVNQDLRAKNRQELRKIGLKTADHFLFTGQFLRQPNAARKASFGDHRSYYYQGQLIDKQVHLGIDLASLAQAPVPAANNGKVVFAGFLGIYGQVVIIDHGLGLQSLYAHLSQIDVQEGESVRKGQIIGRTGSTGMAGGDHLHFGIVISGLPVNPVEWWDLNWLKNNILDR
ncbi:M23 family metallopeptidase [Desulfohalobiaceae bacterium Ax17]|uniref:M23 family metallopeptidase n=1 Tax=Desulfovulcanus ferrireducens TaxID=2831190 RepID=UPI00207BC017|nr:M23 family metallopeptidase [Desulfovulcanus ferrireducens]MBT8764059.1 M23 family metallopeptidase [Desulfovulcanus ferrireducens]